MNSIKELDDLIQEIDTEIADANIENLSDNKAYRYIGWSDYLKNVKRELENEKYKFVFIGQRGIGKTTTILELFGLTKRGKDNKPIDLLSTASGGTTTCEVELLQSQTGYTYFEIEPITDELFNQYIDDFCASYDDKVKDNSDDIQYLPTEIARSLRNMVGLKKSEISDIRKNCATADDFKNVILQRINKSNRVETVIRCPVEFGEHFHFCKEKFNEINLCKIENVFLPKKINVYLTKDMLDFDAYSIISSVVDTRGIDTVASSQKSSNKMKREDILNYIDNEQENCLFFFIDNIKSSPSQNITELLQTRITHENGFRFYIINNIVGSEAEEVMTDNGKAESAEDGIEYKKDDILSKFQQFNIPFSASNLLFYNARINHPSRTDILAVISENINKKHADIYEICEEIRNSFKKTKYDFENNDYALKNFDDLKTIVENVKAPNNLFDIISGRFISELNRIHHARIAAINRYDGEYYAFNFFHEFSLLIESCFDEYFSKSKEKIIDKVNDFLKYRNISELDKLNYKIFLEKFERDYNKNRAELRDFLKEKTKDSFSSKIWQDAVAEYGMGPGYKNRVFDLYKTVFSKFANTVHVNDAFNNEWDEIIKDNALGR